MTEIKEIWEKIMEVYGPDENIALILYLEQSIQDKKLLELIEYWRNL